MLLLRMETHYKEFDDKKRYKLVVGDALDLHKHVEPNSVRLCVTSPPYWDILNEKRTADQKESVNYSDSKKDLGNLHDYNQFLDSLKPKSFRFLHFPSPVLRRRSYRTLIQDFLP